MLFSLPEAVPGTEWLYDGIKLAFRSHANSVLPLSSTTDEPPAPRDPRFAKLIEELRRSKQFVLTYQIVVVGLICLIAIRHWGVKLARWRARRLRASSMIPIQDTVARTLQEDENDETSSSGSSTLQGHESPSRKVPSENAPLLGGVSKPRVPISTTIRSFLLYQPRPLPVVNKVLPSNGTSLFVLFFLAIQLFYLFYNINFTWFELFVFADRAGLVFAMNLPILYLLIAKTSVIRILTGYSYESLNLFHRRLGEVMCFAALLHALGMVGVWYTLFSARMSFWKFLLEKIVWLGVGAFLAYEILYATSCQYTTCRTICLPERDI